MRPTCIAELECERDALGQDAEETRKIFEDDSLAIHATCVRVPVFIGHSEAVNVEFDKPKRAKSKRGE